MENLYHLTYANPPIMRKFHVPWKQISRSLASSCHQCAPQLGWMAWARDWQLSAASIHWELRLLSSLKGNNIRKRENSQHFSFHTIGGPDTQHPVKKAPQTLSCHSHFPIQPSLVYCVFSAGLGNVSFSLSQPSLLNWVIYGRARGTLNLLDLYSLIVFTPVPTTTTNTKKKRKIFPGN